MPKLTRSEKRKIAKNAKNPELMAERALRKSRSTPLSPAQRNRLDHFTGDGSREA
jgi:hypothetical protein